MRNNLTDLTSALISVVCSGVRSYCIGQFAAKFFSYKHIRKVKKNHFSTQKGPEFIQINISAIVAVSIFLLSILIRYIMK